MKRAVCIKLDIVDSRSGSYHLWIEELIKELDDEAVDFLIAPIRRAGDEVFMVVKSMEDAWHCLRRIFRYVRATDQGVYVGIGRGEIKSQDRGSEGVEGSAIYYASDALLELKTDPSTELLSEIMRGSFRYNLVVSDNAVLNNYHTQYLHAIFSRMLGRTELQQEASDLKFFFPDQTNAWYADRLFHSKGGKNAEVNFSKHLNRADYKLLTEMEQTLIDYFDSEDLR